MAKKKNPKKGTTKPISNTRFMVEKARNLPIFGCYINDDWQENGLAHVIVARERADGNLCVGMFLCDAWCLGVKDVYGWINISKAEFKFRVLDAVPNIRECEYVFAHNFVYGAEAFAADADIEPTPGFAFWRKILEEDTEEIPLIEIEFGDNGKYHLVADAGSKEARYAYGLQKKLGDNFIFETFDEDDTANVFEDEKFLEFKKAFTENAPQTMEELLQRVKDGFQTTREEDDRHPDEVYSYVHPDYPEKLEMTYEFIADEFSNQANEFGLSEEVIERIQALPKSDAVHDIVNLIMYTIGRTWKSIDEDSLEWTGDNTLIHSLVFLTELADPLGLDAVLEIVRQDSAFHEFHFGDSVDMIIPQALYVTGRNRLDILEQFLMAPGYDGYCKGYVSEALSLCAAEEPERRDEIIGIYRRYLDFMQENMPIQKGCSGYVAGTIVSDLIDLKAEELLPEIKRLHDCGFVNLNICGDYKRVEKEIRSGRDYHKEFDFKDAKDFYRRFKRAFNH